MEDFSCDNTFVEIQSWKLGDRIPCRFEDNLELIKQKFCIQ
jgi:hypothetical protein